MIDELHVTNVALISDASISFAPGLTALTGETGAGKTALLAALRLVCGQRASASVVTDGAREAVAEARIIGVPCERSASDDSSDDAFGGTSDGASGDASSAASGDASTAALGGTPDDAGAEHVVRRRLSAAGRSRASIDGAMASVSELAGVMKSVRVHSQHEQVRLLKPAAQLAMLDAFISPDGAHLVAWKDALARRRSAADALSALESAADADARELEFARFTVAQISEVAPVAGEVESLEGELPRLKHADQLAAAVCEARSALAGDGGALDSLARASDVLSRLSGVDADLDALAARLADALYELDDVNRDLASHADVIDADPARLAEVLSRLEALSGIERRFGPGMDRVIETWHDAEERISAHESAPERLESARADLADATAALEAEAHTLADVRGQAAREFCDLLGESVRELAMPQASFEFSFEPLDIDHWAESGPHRVELLYRPAASSASRPLARIASGGELSRILLALECLSVAHAGEPVRVGESSCQGQSARAGEFVPAHTIVFDEVDQGVGGKTGTAVAQRLAELACDSQVIVVTHLPQVAALASRHYVVTKDENADGTVATDVREVVGDERVREVARMLAGDTGEVALEHARVLLEGGLDAAGNMAKGSAADDADVADRDATDDAAEAADGAVKGAAGGAATGGAAETADADTTDGGGE